VSRRPARGAGQPVAPRRIVFVLVVILLRS